MMGARALAYSAATAARILQELGRSVEFNRACIFLGYGSVHWVEIGDTLVSSLGTTSARIKEWNAKFSAAFSFV